MRIRFFLAPLLLAGCTVTVPHNPSRPAPNGPNLLSLTSCLQQSGTALIIASRGQARPEAPENSLTGSAEALGDGALLIEADVRRTADGELILLHDATLQRTTTSNGNVATKSFAAIRESHIRVVGGYIVPEPPPSLDEALLHAKRRGVVLLLRLRGALPAGELVETLRNNRMLAHVIVAPETPRDAAELVALAPSLILALPVRSAAPVRAFLGQGTPPSQLLALVDKEAATPSLLQAMQHLGVGVILQSRLLPTSSTLQHDTRSGVRFFLTPYVKQVTNALEGSGNEGGDCYMSALGPAAS